MCLCASLWFWFTYLSSVSGSACICNNMGHYRESYKEKVKDAFRFSGVADYASARLPITLIIDGVWKARPGRWMFLPRMKTHLLYVVMTYTTQPTHISLTRLSYEHASKSLSPLLLIWIYLLLWQWWDGWRSCLQWLLCSPSGWRGRWWWRPTLFCPADCPDGRIYGPPVPILGTRTHCLWVDRSACPCFIDLTPREFTTSAFLVHRLTGERFSGGMRSDRGREMEVEERREEEGGG